MELRTGSGSNRDEIARRLRESLIEVTTTEHQLRTEIERVEAQLAKLPPAPETPALEESPLRPTSPTAAEEPANSAPGRSATPASNSDNAAPSAVEKSEPAPSAPAADAGSGSAGPTAEDSNALPAPTPNAAPGADTEAAGPSGPDEAALVSGLPRPPTNAGPRARLETRLAELQVQLGNVQAAKESIATQLRDLPATLATAEANANVLAVRQLLAAAGIDDPDRESLEPLAELSTLSVDEELAALRREMGLDPPAPPIGSQPAASPDEPNPPEAKKPAE